MKHPLKLTILLISLFVITQLIGLYVVNFYISDGVTIPYGFDQKEVAQLSWQYILPNIIFSFILAILLIFILMKFKLNWIIKIWFFVVIAFTSGTTAA